MTPSGQMFSVMKNHIGGRLCFAAKDAVATEKEDSLTITLINRSYDGNKKFTLPEYGKTVVSTLYEAESVLPYSDFRIKDVDLTATEDGYEVILPKHSVMLIRMKKKQ